MVTTMGVVYLVFGTLLFGFWIYGIVSFYYDVKRQILPALRERRDERRREQAEQEEAVERLAQLYGTPDDEQPRAATTDDA